MKLRISAPRLALLLVLTAVATLVVDRLWTSVGSTNFDTRSFRLNDEANLNIHDREFALRQIADFEKDLKKSRRITYGEWANRLWTEKVWENFVGLFGAQL